MAFLKKVPIVFMTLALLMAVLVVKPTAARASEMDLSGLDGTYGQYWPSTFSVETYSSSDNYFRTRFEFRLTPNELMALRQVDDWLELDFDHQGFDFPNSFDGYTISSHNLPGGKKDNNWGDGTDLPEWLPEEAEYPVPGITGIETSNLQANTDYHVEIEWTFQSSSTPKVAIDWVPSHWAGDHLHPGVPSGHNSQKEDFSCFTHGGSDPGWCVFPTVRVWLTFNTFGWSTFNQGVTTWSTPSPSWAQYVGHIVRWHDGTSWLVDADGRHWIPTGGDYLCFESYGSVVYDYQTVMNAIGGEIPDNEGSHAICTPGSGGSYDGSESWDDSEGEAEVEPLPEAAGPNLVGDIDGDGKDDFTVFRRFYSDNTTFPVITWGNSNRSSTSRTTAWTETWTGEIIPVGAGDIDGDGEEDIVTLRHFADNTTKMIVTWGKPSHGSLSRSTAWTVAWGGEIYPVGIGDFDDDGKDDVAVLRRLPDDTAKMIVTWGNSDRSKLFRTAGWQSNWTGEIIPVGVGDFDSDGMDDIVVIRRYYSDNTTFAVVTWGTTNRKSMSRTTVWNATWPGELHPAGVGDLDGNGKDDFVVMRRYGGGNETKPAVSWGTNNRQSMSRSAPWISNWNGEIIPMGLGDFDDDGKDDIAVIRRFSDDLTKAIVTWGSSNHSSMSRTKVWQSNWPGEIHRVGVGDFDGNGKDDFIAFRRYGSGNETKPVYSWDTSTRSGMSRTNPWISNWTGEIIN